MTLSSALRLPLLINSLAAVKLWTTICESSSAMYLKSNSVSCLNRKRISCRAEAVFRGIREGKLRRGASSSWTGKYSKTWAAGTWAADTQQQQHLYNVQMWQRCACPENWFGVHSTEFFQSKDILIFPVSFHHLSKHLKFHQIKKVKSLYLPFHDSPLPIYDSPANVQSSHFENAANGQAVIYLHRIVGGLMIPKLSSYFGI